MEAFTNPVVMAAIVAGVAAVSGTIASTVSSLKKHKTDTSMVALTKLVDHHSERMHHLEEKIDSQNLRIDELSMEVNSMYFKNRKLGEKYSVSLTYIVSLWTSWFGLRAVLRRDGISYGEPPPVPEIIAVDMQPIPEGIKTEHLK